VHRDGSDFLIQTTSRAPGGSFEQPQTLSDFGVMPFPPRIATNSQGDAVVMWPTTTLGYQWATRPAGAAAFGTVHTVVLSGGERASSLALRLSDAGEPAAVILTQADEGTLPNIHQHWRVRTLTRAPSGALQVGPVLDEGTNDSANSWTFGPLDLDVDAAGTFYATWTRVDNKSGGPSTSVSAVRLSVRPPGAGTAFAPAEDVATAAVDPGTLEPDARLGDAAGGVDAGGTFRVVYRRVVDSPAPPQSELLLRTRPPGGGLEAGAETIVPLEPNGPFNLAFDVGVGGGSVVAWARGPDVSHRSIDACIRPPSGPCGPTQPLASGQVFAPVAAMGAGGAAVTGWRRTLSGADASFAPGGTFGPAHVLGDSATQILLPAEATAVDPMGDAVLFTETNTSTGTTIAAHVNDSAPPAVTGLSVVPAVGDLRQPLAFDGSISDVWSPFTAAWAFGDGDGSSGPGPGASHAYAHKGTFNAVLSATDSEGNVGSAAAAVTVRRIPPRILSFGMTHRVFAVGRKATPLSGARRHPAVGTVFRFRLSEASTARIGIQRKRGRRWKTVGTLKRRTPAGKKRVPFSGRLRRKPLAAGRYRAVLVASDSSKNRSKPRRLGFRVVHG
jgi:hypothetical protein